jgi:hypothetical protein
MPSNRLAVRGSTAIGLIQVIGGIYDSVGLPPDELLKSLVVSRIASPGSKRSTVRFMADNLGQNVSLTGVYRYMDSLDKNKLMNILLSYAQERSVLLTGDFISVVFYDVTTLDLFPYLGSNPITSPHSPKKP